MGLRLVQELAADGIDVAVACRVLKVSRSGHYEWRGRPPSARDVEDAYLANTILDIHQMSRCSYGAPWCTSSSVSDSGSGSVASAECWEPESGASGEHRFGA